MKIIIIGAGPGGYETAVDAAKRGMEVVIINGGELGGTCLNEGCIPTKTFWSMAQRDGGTNMTAIQEKKKEVIGQLQNGIEMLLKNKLITVINDRASFVDDKTVRLASDGTCLTADKIIIATGSLSASLPVAGAEYCITSSDMLQLTTVPKRLCVIGGGVIGLEFASIFNHLGSEVTVLEYCKQILPRFDTDLAKRLKQCLVKSGIKIETDFEVKAVEKNGEEYVIDGMSYDLVLMAVGRRPNIEGLGLENTSIEYTKRGITVDENMLTSVPNVYAIGDVNAKMMLAHVATFQGRRVLNHIEGKSDKIRFGVVPSAVFTIPEAAAVGMTEEESKEHDIVNKAYKSFYRANGKAVSMGETEGYLKIICDDTTGKILGAHAFGAHSSDIIHEVAALINFGATIDDLKDIIHAHPTLSEIVQNVQ